jgi:hypothetical protein
MEIINVITIKDGILDEIKSFGIFDEKKTQNVVDKAEAYYNEKCIEYGYDEDDSDDSMDDLIEEGCYVGGNFSICISWSDI